jgi:ubiquinone/menaquinone biosynthesis C-methylase UbiE
MNSNQLKIQRAFEHPEWYLTGTAYNITIRMETVRTFLKDMGGRRSILDIGCGDGSLSVQLLDRQTTLTLLDRSASMLKVAASRVPDDLKANVKIVTDNFLTAELPAQEFDLIICVGVLAYVDDLNAFTQKLVLSLKPNGSLIVECSDGDHFVRRLLRAYGRVRRTLGASNFDTVARPGSAVVGAFHELGFTPRQSFRYSHPLPVIRKLLSQGGSYKVVRAVHGTAIQNRASWLGSECIYHFVRTP